jgi:hypothetical protein
VWFPCTSLFTTRLVTSEDAVGSFA